MFYVFQRGLLLLVTLAVLRIFFPDLTEEIVSIILRILQMANSMLNYESPESLDEFF